VVKLVEVVRQEGAPTGARMIKDQAVGVAVY
jgi:hypothetical protein